MCSRLAGCVLRVSRVEKRGMDALGGTKQGLKPKCLGDGFGTTKSRALLQNIRELFMNFRGSQSLRDRVVGSNFSFLAS